MQTRNALRKLGGAQQHELGEGPLADIAQQLVANWTAKEDARMAAAEQRAASMGAGPHLAALQRLAREAAASSLINHTAPAIMCADMHTLLKAASATHSSDRGLSRAATHAYRLWSKDPQGTLTVGDVARLRAHYAREYPRSKIAEVIDKELPKVGFNTLPVARLTRIAMDIARHSDTEGADPQTVYEGVMQREALTGNLPEQIRARAYIRGLLANVGEAESDIGDPLSRTLSRMASHDDPVLSRVGQEIEDDEEYVMEPDEAELPHDETEEEMTTIPSPITGEDLVLELGVEETPEEDLGTNEVDVTPEDIGTLSVMGQLEEFMDAGDEEEPDSIPMGPEGEETTAIIPDPSDVEGGELEVTLRAVEPEEPMEMEPPSEDETMESEAGSGVPGMAAEAAERPKYEDAPPVKGPRTEREEKDVRKFKDEPEIESPYGLARYMRQQRRDAFVVYAYSNGRRAAEPLDTFEAAGMASALRRIANHGVRGEVRSTPDALATEAIIVLDADKGEYLSVTAAEKLPGKDVMEPDVNAQQPAYMSGPSASDGLKAIQSDDMGKQNHPHGKLSKGAIKERCAQLGLTAVEIEHRLLGGEVVKAAGWSLACNDDDNVELRYSDGQARTASLVYLDDVIDNFMAHVAHNTPPPAAPVTKQAFYGITELFAIECDGCGAVNEYTMPKVAEAAQCGCGHETPVERIAASFEQGNPITGYLVVTDMPNASDARERTLHARRMLAAVKKVAPGAKATLRKDAKLEISLSGDQPALARVQRVLEDRYGVQAYKIEAQVMSQNAEGTPMAQPVAPLAPTTPQQQPAQTQQSYVGPPEMPTVQPVQPTQPTAQPAQTGTAPQLQAAYEIEYEDSEGKMGRAPVDAASADTARAVFARFNPDCKILKVGQMAAPPPAPAPAPMPDVAPGAPEMGGEDVPMPIEDQMAMEPEPTGGPMTLTPPEVGGGVHLNPDETEAVKAALTHYRNQGVGPMTALDQLSAQYRDLIERYGEKTDLQRHMIEAEAMKIAAEVWMKPAIMQVEAQKGPTPPSINTQQPDYVQVPKDLGKDSETDDAATSAVEAPTINTQVDTIATQPGASGADTSTQPDTETNDPGDFGAGKPKTQHPATDQKGVSLTPTDLGKDSDTGESQGGTTKMMDSTSSGAYNNVRSK